ncbi:unnamed protein product [Acanthoscelides obtectus]|uniref:DDE-1 domain-containing protein n=1 Tax=Acanthoscelides obtectus TaxID=200917 RepID=A0A9P0QBU3_ACAOB|nr:unnamed protein product [Acanthoscelides obtectus]CAK1628395.1 hypothetical protein AOBTE_LOCUS5181 [Acanthoscelides obtectus]
MRRNYKKRLGSRNYKNYTQENLRACLASIENKVSTQRRASEECDCILRLSEYGFPLTAFDLRIVIRTYLDRIGRKVTKFRDNCPGTEWVSSFLKRRPCLTQRFAANIKRSRAAVDKETVIAYIKNLEDVVRDVLPENIWNFDETNLSDDPGQKKIITKRVAKYLELIRNTSKSSTSIMFAGNAVGELLPPYVVYKSKQLWSTWTEHGTKRVRYNNSPSGWFDMNIFNDWFFTQILPRLKKQECPIIGDNLSSHISVDVLKACDQNNIRFVCLPSHSTHLTQPLDVAFFHPMKVAWRKILTEWKASVQGSRETVVQKSSFPVLLNRLIDILEPTREANLISGFRKCGIFPLDVNPFRTVDQTALQDSFLQSLEAKRLEWTKGGTTKRRQTKLNITPGKSVTEELSKLSDDKENGELAKPSTARRPRHRRASSESSYADSVNMSVHDSSDVASLDDLENLEVQFNAQAEGCGKNIDFKPLVKAVGQYVVFTYEGEIFPGKITKICEQGPYVSSMKKSLKSWKWPELPDEIQYHWEEILGCIDPPKKVSLRRDIYSVPALNQIWRS